MKRMGISQTVNESNGRRRNTRETEEMLEDYTRRTRHYGGTRNRVLGLGFFPSRDCLMVWARSPSGRLHQTG